MSRRHYLVTYDIADDKRRALVFRLLEDNGDHVQYSVFYCELNAQERVLMEGGLKEVIHHDQDQVLILDLGQGAAPLESALHTLGKTYVPPCRVQVVWVLQTGPADGGLPAAQVLRMAGYLRGPADGG